MEAQSSRKGFLIRATVADRNAGSLSILRLCVYLFRP